MSAMMWLVVLFVSSLVPGTAQQAPSDDASHRAKLLEQAEHGDAKAQFELCQDNAYGFNGAKDVQQAIRWCRKAIESGNTAARSILGQIYFDGNGVTRDFAEAAKWFGCPHPSAKILSTCQETSQDSLPPGAVHFLAQLKCDDTSAWDGSEVDLAGEGAPAYLVCCREAPHGPCGAVLIAKVRGKWSDLTAKEACWASPAHVTASSSSKASTTAFTMSASPSSAQPGCKVQSASLPSGNSTTADTDP